MGWCERCGRFFILASNRTISRGIGARGPVGEVITTVCPGCLTITEQYDNYFNVIPKDS